MNKLKVLSAFLVSAFLFVNMGTASAQISLAEKQLQNLAKVKFTNYSGPVKQTYNVQDIIAIGYSLASNFKNNASSYVDGRYQIKRVLCVSNVNLYSADMFILGPSAQANHIKTLNRILSAYIQKQFNYTRKQADTIASFALNYNAIMRGNKAHFEANYGPEVNAAINPSKVGISLNYKNWPDNTQVILPLNVSELYGKKMSAQELYKETEENLRGKPDKGIDEREKMLDVMKKDLTQKESVLQQKQQEKQKDIEKTEGDIKNLKEGEASVKRDQALEEKNKELAEKKKEQQDLMNEAQKLQDEGKAIEASEALLEKDKAEVNVSGQESAKYVYYLKLLGTGRDLPLKQLVSIDKETFETFRTKDGIAGQNLLVFQGNVVAISPSTAPSFSITLFDGDTLDVLKKSPQAVYPMTHLAQDSGFIYAIFEKNKKYFLGKFDEELALKTTSAEGLYQNSDIVVSKENIYVTVLDKGVRKVAVLKKEDLTTVKIPK